MEKIYAWYILNNHSNYERIGLVFPSLCKLWKGCTLASPQTQAKIPKSAWQSGQAWAAPELQPQLPLTRCVDLASHFPPPGLSYPSLRQIIPRGEVVVRVKWDIYETQVCMVPSYNTKFPRNATIATRNLMPQAAYYDVGMRLLVALETNKEIFFQLSFLYSKKCRGNHFQNLNTGACSWVSMLPRLAASERAESDGRGRFSGQLFRRQRGAAQHCGQLWFRDLLGQGGGPNTFPFRPFWKARIEVLTCPRGCVFLSADIQTKSLFWCWLLCFL